MRTRSILAFIFFLVLIWSCNPKQKYFYPEDTSVSNENGIPNNENVLYFPLDWILSQYKSGEYTSFIDSGYFQRESEMLYALKEPVLYNYYLKKDIYRLTWIRSFEPDICISFEKQGDSLLLIEKKFTKPFTTKYFRPDSVDENGYLVGIPSDTTLEINSKRKIDIAVWNELDNLVEKSRFDTLNPIYTGIPISDGYSWIIEMHKKDKYYMVDRQLGGDISEIGNFMIEQTIFKEINN